MALLSLHGASPRTSIGGHDAGRRDTAPSIIKAQEIKSALADMDADAANELLDPKDSRAVQRFEPHRVEASDGMIEAAHNITYRQGGVEPD